MAFVDAVNTKPLNSLCFSFARSGLTQLVDRIEQAGFVCRSTANSRALDRSHLCRSRARWSCLPYADNVVPD
jgi:hypothetical protein